ncbi:MULTISPECIES: class I SAM-dependent methyltransferase [unclassified Microbulbifer]|uniref:class I SAM-dependent methyltransferase n=1 Tax=unclassified Microbulbifer TaxID=2619833 RepID=UPI0027E440BE|nr:MULTISPECIES: class I SAM-dependent methyltransferase [unclassified Microbulbifer]
MQRDSIRKIFDQQAASYDQQWSKMAPLRDALHLLMGAVFSDLPEDAHILCVGAGTGAELIYLAERFPQWRFTVVEPSAAMLEVCRRRAGEQGIAPLCHFHEGYVEALDPEENFDAATALLVSQFILEREARAEFFRAIARRLRPGGMLASSDLASDTDSAAYQRLLEVWLQMMRAGGIPPEGLERMRAAYDRDVALLPPEQVEDIIMSGGFRTPTQFLQTGLIRAWYAKRAPDA